ncbi:2-oxo-4-hydroxy-4-carboxy-5-ureidoimidazoline decarboxylase [Actinoallomurus acaciae]|uniref:2-oxo-4-hydroxy-4-carboxy-5-ureidoimidazoline decarboxylase n=1 Tax=Actinoallomurus acaciae TaxID=502577 RepID=A0ABV5YS58_9ACTN
MRFDGLSRADAEAELLACCASRRWAAAVAEGRPYGSAERLFAAARRAVRDLDWADVEEALQAHPRIGERAASALSRAEQSGVGDRDRAAFTAANAEYEERFGHVFLICASGRGAPEMLAELRERLGNDPARERDVVHGELVKITELRLRRLGT